MDDCLDSTGDAQFFSTLDCNAEYWQIPIAKEDKPKTAFTCHCGTYQCTRLPFGLCNAPATLRRAIDMILSGVKWQNVLVYLDDLIIFSADAESHLSHLDTVLTLLRKHGVTFKAQKCHLFSNEFEYLGHVVRPGRLSVNEKNLKAIKKAVLPKTQTQLRSFLGMCNVYRRFTVDFAQTAKPLNDLNSVKLPKRLSPPTSEEQAAFDKLREQLCHPPNLAIPRKEGRYIIDIDAFHDQQGCCLLQQQSDDKYLPIGYFSKGLLPAEKNYTVPEIERLRVVWAVGLLRPYIEGNKFLIRCDHKALKCMLTTTASTNNRFNRWRILLSEFDSDVEYKPSPQHAVADALSRIPTEGLDEGQTSQQIPTVGVTTRSGTVLDPRLRENRETAHISLSELAQKQATDDFCQGVKKALDTRTPTRFYENADGLFCRQGHPEGTQQFLVPQSVVKDVLRAEHSSPFAAHPGGTRMYQTLRDQYTWPSLAVDVFGWVAACPICAKNRLMGTQSKAFMRLFPATEPFAALAIDLLGPLPRTSEGYEYILVICDQYTKVTRAVPLRDITALDVLSAFLDTGVANYGLSASVLSDNGPQFAAVLWQGVLKVLGVDTNYATPCHPQTDGQVERYDETLVKQVRHHVSEHVVTWSRYLSLVVTAYNPQVYGSTGQNPFAFVSPRRHSPVAIERLTKDREAGQVVSPRQAKEKLLQRLDFFVPLVRETMEKAQARYKQACDPRVRQRRESH